MDSIALVFLFYYFRELGRNARERARLEAELAPEVSGVFERPQLERAADSPRPARGTG